jgi:multiple sugar transport system permease protein
MRFFTGKKEQRLTAAVFLLPTYLSIFLVMVYPLLQCVYFSLTNKLFTYKSWSFIGLDNYVKLFQDQLFHVSFLNSIKLTLAVVAGNLLLGLLLALLMNRPFPLRGLIRALLLLPWVVPTMVTTIMFRWLYNDFYGYVNYFLVKNHFLSQPFNILADAKLAWLGVAMPMIWREYPFVMLVFLAALQSIDRRLYESAQIDGAGRWQMFRYITLPGLKPAFVIAIILELIWRFSTFDLVYLLTDGGPRYSTLTLPVHVFHLAFKSKELGYASALGTIMFIVLLVLCLTYFRVIKRRQENIEGQS